MREDEILALEERFEAPDNRKDLCSAQVCGYRGAMCRRCKSRSIAKAHRSRARLRYSQEPSEEVADLLFPRSERPKENVPPKVAARRRDSKRYRLSLLRAQMKKSWHEEQGKRRADWVEKNLEAIRMAKNGFSPREGARLKNKYAAREAQVKDFKSRHAFVVEIGIGFDLDRRSSRLAHYAGMGGRNLRDLASKLSARGISVLLDDTRHSLFLGGNSAVDLRRCTLEMANLAQAASGLLSFKPIAYEAEQMCSPTIELTNPALVVGPEVKEEASRGGPEAEDCRGGPAREGEGREGERSEYASWSQAVLWTQ